MAILGGAVPLMWGDFIMLSVIYLNLLEVISVLIRTYTNTNKKITPGHPQESHHFIEKFASQMLCTAQAAAFLTLGTSEVLAHRSRETLWHLGFEHQWHQWKHEINKNWHFTNWFSWDDYSQYSTPPTSQK